MKLVSYIVLLILVPALSIAQKPLTPEAGRVKAAYEWLLKQPNFPENHIHFIESFPNNKDHYIEVFTPHTFDQLYFDYEAYLAKYRELGRMYPKQVLAKSMVIGKKLSTAGGPAGIMQQTIMEVANINPAAFAAEVKKLKKNEQLALIGFLADVPDHNNYPQYHTLIKELEKLQETKIADIMIAARDTRVKQSQ
jgi:hypothetical protein